MIPKVTILSDEEVGLLHASALDVLENAQELADWARRGWVHSRRTPASAHAFDRP